MITAARLRKRLSYDAAAGLWLWISGRLRGRPAGHLEEKGYRRIWIEGRSYKAHRLAHLYMHGKWPKHTVDHKRGVLAGDGADNLRPATRSQQSQNRKTVSMHGLKGISYRSNCPNRPWEATIGKAPQRYIGNYATKEAAARAYDLEAFRAYGEFAKLNYPDEIVTS